MVARIGVFGGTFDPPHLGHLILASEARLQLNLTRVLWVLAAVPPHKPSAALSPIEDRTKMLRLAIGDEPGFELSRVEIERPGPHFTVDTLTRLRAQHPGSDLILILGGDSLKGLPQWHRPADLVAACDGLGVMRRPSEDFDLRQLEKAIPGLGTKLSFIDAPLLEIASHQIRDRVKREVPIKYYVPAPVDRYIVERQLYRDTGQEV